MVYPEKQLPSPPALFRDTVIAKAEEDFTKPEADHRPAPQHGSGSGRGSHSGCRFQLTW